MRKEEIKYRVVISTNTFATNFEKELCAFVTGQIGECKVGIDRRFYSSAEMRDIFEKAMERRLCDDGYWRPVQTSPKDVNSFELFFKERPTQQMMDHIREACDEFAEEKKDKNPLTNKITFDNIVVIKERSLYEESEEVYDNEKVTN